MRYVFGKFVLDSGTRQLSKAGREIAIGAKAFALLEALLRSRPRVLSRTHLHLTLWPDSHVGATSLHVVVSHARAALDDDPDREQWIRTVHGFGYAFRGDASEEPEAAGRKADLGGGVEPRAFRLRSSGGSVALAQGENVIGRQTGLRPRINEPGVSRRHALIVVRNDKATIEDLGSKNGTFVGGERISSPRLLRAGDVIRLGQQVQLVVEREDATATEG